MERDVLRHTLYGKPLYVDKDPPLRGPLEWYVKEKIAKRK